MRKETFCYAARDAGTGNKLVGGMLHADDLEDAAKRVVCACEATLEVTGTRELPRVEWVRKGRRVYLSVSVHPDHHLTDEARAQIAALPSRYDDEG